MFRNDNKLVHITGAEIEGSIQEAPGTLARAPLNKTQSGCCSPWEQIVSDPKASLNERLFGAAGSSSMCLVNILRKQDWWLVLGSRVEGGDHTLE